MQVDLRTFTDDYPEGQMQISPEQGLFMAQLASMIGARRAIEVGVFTGYSGLCVASRLPQDGVLVACEIDQERAQVAMGFWQQAGVADRIDLRLGPAIDTLDAMIESGDEGYDYMFIDADKEMSIEYFERGMRLLRRGGIILLDNMFLHGDVIDPTRSEQAEVMNRFVHDRVKDDRVDFSIVPIGDGIGLSRIC